jgi:large subunit ribosomal protein L25
MENTETLKVKVREAGGKGPARRLRMAGQIPGVCYGKNFESLMLEVDPKELAKRLTGAYGLNALFKLDIEGHDASPVVRVSEYQRDPVKRTLQHVDFHAVEGDMEVITKVPLKLEGRPVGVAAGGTLKQVRYDIKVRGPVASIPTHVTVAVGNLNIGEMARVSSVQLPEGITAIYDDDFGVASVFLTRSAKAAMAAAAG